MSRAARAFITLVRSRIAYPVCGPDQLMKLLLKNLLFTVLVPGTVAVYIPLVASRGDSPASGPLLGIGIALLTLGVAVYVWCVWDFATRGAGTPAPIDAPKRLVIRGLYSYSRNPMYVGVLIAILGWTAVFGSVDLLLYAAAVGTLFHLRVVLYEEPHLRGEFGDEYETYRASTNRWLPKFRRPAA